ncbi:hypothetical protein [Caulobacter mirabilis]|uniref:Uncharacterized protein n=1 Tax=Caulobacter mirabilis TaxID=69666 RepID=A0A2D2AST4_9CAUL|nr:hypothetical protein [Caulobacter mirabilis]ATQ41025.1 hypothetical protein CSW64_00690 [Caulobacter mirabilis]
MPAMRMTLAATACLAALALAGCGDRNKADQGDNAVAASGRTAAPSLAVAQRKEAPKPPEPRRVKCDEYRPDLEDGDMVMIYHGTLGTPPPMEAWAERSLHQYDSSGNPEVAWTTAKTAVQAQFDAVAGIRCLTLPVVTQLSRYDPARGGVVIEDFGDGRFFSFGALGEHVRLKIRNGAQAGVWPMPADRAEAMLKGARDQYRTRIVARVRILSARPAQGYGVLEGEVVGFDVYSDPYGTAAKQLATVVVPGAGS